MKHRVLTTIAAVMLVGCSSTQKKDDMTDKDGAACIILFIS